MSAVVEKLRAAGIPKEAIQTIAIDLQPEFDYHEGKQTLRGYVARNSIEVRVDTLPKLGDIIDMSVSAGAARVGGVRFDLQDRDAAEREALKLAVGDARERAAAAAAGAGMEPGRVLRIEEHRMGDMPPPRPMAMREMMTDPAFNIFYDAGTLVVICRRSGSPLGEGDCWLAAENFMLAAFAEGLGTCCIGLAQAVLNTAEAKRELGIPDEGAAVVAIIVGVPGETPASSPRKPPQILSWLA